MKRRADREKIKLFMTRKKANLFGLLAITILSIAATSVFALRHSSRTNILVTVTVLLVFLCALQIYRMRNSYRTMRTARGVRKKKKNAPDA